MHLLTFRSHLGCHSSTVTLISRAKYAQFATLRSDCKQTTCAFPGHHRFLDPIVVVTIMGMNSELRATIINGQAELAQRGSERAAAQTPDRHTLTGSFARSMWIESLCRLCHFVNIGQTSSRQRNSVNRSLKQCAVDLVRNA
jgi:hypothetical protein